MVINRTVESIITNLSQARSLFFFFLTVKVPLFTPGPKEGENISLSGTGKDNKTRCLKSKIFNDGAATR